MKLRGSQRNSPGRIDWAGVIMKIVHCITFFDSTIVGSFGSLMMAGGDGAASWKGNT